MSSGKQKLKAIEGTGMRISTRKSEWVVPPEAPTKADDLSFTSRDSVGRIRWWDVTLPKTDYCHVHQILGRAYAFEYLDWVNNPDGDCGAHTLAFIVSAMSRQHASDGSWKTLQIMEGFLEVIGEMITTGTARR